MEYLVSFVYEKYGTQIIYSIFHTFDKKPNVQEVVKLEENLRECGYYEVKILSLSELH